MNKYADIALPVAVDKTFTYLLPPELEPASIVGVRAIVPFGKKYATGIIVGHPEEPSVTGLKPVRDILDHSPILTTDVLQLCRWIASYYLAPLGEVLKAALPQGFSPASKRFARLAENPPGDRAHLSAQRQRVLGLIEKQGRISLHDLRRRTGSRNINALINEMEQAGYLRIEEVIPRPKGAVKTREYVLLGEINEEAVRTTISVLSERKRKARAVLHAMMALRAAGFSEVAVNDLVKRSGANSAVAKELIAAGALPVVQREVGISQDHGFEERTLSITLNPDQVAILSEIRSALSSSQHRTFLLHGVTGSGKTQVYIEAIRLCLGLGKAAIVLVPEIALTPQTVRRFNAHFPGLVAVVHSRMSIGERAETWRQTLLGKYRIVIGPRSALFAPVDNLGLLVVDEEHESSYKQYDAVPRYHARDAAVMRGSLSNAVVILGSATPSIESYYNAHIGKYRLLQLPSRVDDIPMPAITVVDMRAERSREYAAAKERPRSSVKWRQFQQCSVSPILQEKMVDRMGRGEGIILLQNRRGFSPFVECMDCGYAESCTRCSVTLTYHLAKKHLRCHYCGSVYTPHQECPQCGGANLMLRGIGTQRVEEELASMFPEARILRMDLDTTSRKGAHDQLLRRFGNRQADILLGTQMVAKGLDFPHVTLVGVISADTQMLLPDFRASERTFQLLTQVAGRAGRSALSGEVIIQTHQPEHHTLAHVLDHSFQAFYEQELAERQELAYPPFSRLILIEFKGTNERHVQSEAERFRNIIVRSDGLFTLLGPSPAVISKINNQFRWHLIVKMPKEADPSGTHGRSVLRNAMTIFAEGRKRSVKVIIDVDPVGLM